LSFTHCEPKAAQLPALQSEPMIVFASWQDGVQLWRPL